MDLLGIVVKRGLFYMLLVLIYSQNYNWTNVYDSTRWYTICCKHAPSCKLRQNVLTITI